MSEAADRSGCDELSEPERDVMVASLLGITPDRLRTMRRLHSKRVRNDARAGRSPNGTAGPARWWQCVDQLDDRELFDAVRRREVRARVVTPPRVISPLDRSGREGPAPRR